MAMIDIKRLIEDAKDGDLQATRVLHERARRLQDPDLFDLLTGIRKNKIAKLKAELSQWEHFITGNFVAIKLLSYGLKKIHAIKEVRRVSGLGLKEAKYVADVCPMIIPKKYTDIQAAQKVVDDMLRASSELRLEIVTWPEDYATDFNRDLARHFASRGRL